jgi:hypothetical protein
MSNPSQEQQLEWEKNLAAGMAAWPRLQQLAETVGITTDPTDVIPTFINHENTRQTAPLAAFFTLIEDAMNHQANQADTDNLDWQMKVLHYKSRLTTLLMRSPSQQRKRTRTTNIKRSGEVWRHREGHH